MVLGSHNSWSYLTPKKWWMKLIRFTAQCQKADIFEQYSKYNVRCFDLRVRFVKDHSLLVVHNMIEYKIEEYELLNQLAFLNGMKKCYVRILLDVRKKKHYTKDQRILFQELCLNLEYNFANIKFWCGRNLYNWNKEFKFKSNPTCLERYASVCKPRIIDDWFPYLYAKKNNKSIKKRGTKKDILLIDFVDL